MKLTETEDSWYFEFDDGTITYIHIDFRLGLDIMDTSRVTSVTIETRCQLHGTEGDVWLTPSEASSLAPILPLFNARVTGVAVQKTGQMKVEFADGWTLGVDPDDAYEAWQIGCPPIKALLVCSPGGYVSFFG